MAPPLKREKKVTVSSEDIELQDISEAPTMSPEVLKERQKIIHYLETKIEKKQSYIDLVIFLVFLILLTSTVILSRQVFGANMIYLGLEDALLMEEFSYEDSHIYKCFWDIGSIEEFFQWLNGPFLGVLTADEWYNGDPLDDADRDYIYQYNKLLGGIRIKQLRVNDDGCTVDEKYNALVNDKCYPFWSSGSSNKTSFGPPNDPERYVYRTQGELDGVPFWGHVSSYYSGGGFNVDIPRDSDYAAIFQQLEEDKYIDRATRLVTIIFHTVNPSIDNAVSQGTLYLEFSPGGYIWLKASFTTIHLLPYVTATDQFRAVLEFIMVLYFIWYVVKEVREIRSTIKTHGSAWKYFNIWNIYDWFTLALFFTAIIMTLVYLLSDRTFFDAADTEYIELERLTQLYVEMYNIYSFVVLLFFFKIFKFLRLNRKLSYLWDTLALALKDLVGFMVVFAVVILSFSLMGYMVFGPEMPEFNTIISAVATLFQMVLGELPYEEMKQVNRFIAPIFCTLFLLLVFFTLTNIFLAVLNNSWEYVHRYLEEDKSATFGELCKEFYHASGKKLNRVFRRKKATKKALSSKKLLNLMVEKSDAPSNDPDVLFANDGAAHSKLSIVLEEMAAENCVLEDVANEKNFNDAVERKVDALIAQAHAVLGRSPAPAPTGLQTRSVPALPRRSNSDSDEITVEGGALP
eukprot:GCRY01005703.1.p1 GENE.GCRY01005703.1~~GCRY01005703.1.p1  ORF type:complete len:687 (+),score=195.89 GCRY01005703.1:117-2177(+)